MKDNALNVYLIDDSIADSLITEQRLKKHPRINNIRSFNDPQEALDDILYLMESKQALPDIIILDIIMPEFDGFDFIDELDEHIDESFTSKLFILSSTTFRSHFEDFEKQRLSTDMLVKPLSTQDLDNLINKHFPEKKTISTQIDNLKKRVKF